MCRYIYISVSFPFFSSLYYIYQNNLFGILYIRIEFKDFLLYLKAWLNFYWLKALLIFKWGSLCLLAEHLV